MFIFWKKRNNTFFIHSAMQSHCSCRSSIYGGVWWWYNFTCCKMAASLGNHQRNVKKSSYPTNMVCPKGDLKKIFRVTFCIFSSSISLLFCFIYVLCNLIIFFHLIIMFLHTAASWLDGRLEQISHCSFLWLSVVWSQQNLPHSSSIDWFNFNASLFHLWTVSPICRRSAH